MSSATIVSLPRISNHKLAELVRNKDPGVSIVDVRDSDFIGGHIVGCQNVPTSTHDYRMPELVRTLKDQDTVVFHCALSQQRGPSSALRYLRERERMSAKGELGGGKGEEGKEQKVVVLEGGFTKWQEKYGEDKELTEGYVKDLWDDSSY
ncbi:Cdc25 phosphatase Ibp1 [Teratosphaeriaceae sp. CCFEE 6253]|nr:Cdc25 phosphatase Ibp1 [Teratosphaeriaceae sp. CCFEE 6253]